MKLLIGHWKVYPPPLWPLGGVATVLKDCIQNLHQSKLVPNCKMYLKVKIIMRYLKDFLF